MRLTITILCGTRAGQRFVVAGGETIRFGRTAKADVVLADDPTMSALHFELECAENAVLVRDLHSRNRLFLNGEPVTEAVLVDSDQLRAGRTYFSISITDPLAPTNGPSAADETRAPGPLDATHAERRAPISTTVPLVVDRQGAVDRLYTLVDGESGTPFVEEARRANRRTASLAFAGFSADRGHVAAFLVEVPHDSASVRRWRSRHGAGGILIDRRLILMSYFPICAKLSAGTMIKTSSPFPDDTSLIWYINGSRGAARVNWRTFLVVYRASCSTPAPADACSV